MPRRNAPRANSAEGMIRAAANVAAGDLLPPRHVKLRRGDKAFFRAITHARARDEWTDATLTVAAQLARCQADIQTESERLDVEGSTLKNEKGTLIANPRFSVMNQLAGRELAFMRALGMVGRVAGDPRDEASRRAMEDRMRKTQAAVSQEDQEEPEGESDGHPLLA